VYSYLEELVLEFNIDTKALGAFDISGSDASWRAKADLLARKLKGTLEQVVKACVHAVYGNELNERDRERKARSTLAQVISKRKPKVSAFLRRAIAYALEALRIADPEPAPAV